MTFPVDYAAQSTYFQELVARINLLSNAGNAVVVTKATDPRQSDFTAAWVAAGNDLPIPPDVEFHWYDGTKLRGIYGTLRDGYICLRQLGGDFPLSGPRFSPVLNDERVLYIGSENATDEGKIFIGDLYGPNTVVPNSHTSDRYPDWNNDATKIVATTTEFGGVNHIVTMNADGTGRTQVTTVSPANTMPSWVGSKIVFVTNRHGALNEQIYSINDNGTGETRLTNNAFRDLHPHISPDGTKIVFASNRSGAWHIWTMDINGANQTDTNLDADTALGFIVTPQWSHDGTKIWYFGDLVQNRAIVNLTVNVLFRANPDGSGAEQMSGFVRSVGTWVASSTGLSEARFSTLSVASDETRFISGLNNTVYRQEGLFTIDADLDASTGKVWLLQPETSDWSDFQLLGQMLSDGTHVELHVENIGAEFDSLLILVAGSIDSTLTAENLLLTFNEDAANHHTLIQSATAAVVGRTESMGSPGVIIPMDTDVTDAGSWGSYYIFVPDIHSLDSYKCALFHGGRINTYAAGGIQHVMGVGYYASTNDVTQVKVRPANALPWIAGSKVSVYGLAGRGRYRPQ